MSDGAWLIVCIVVVAAGWAFIQWQEIKPAEQVAENRRNRKCAPPPPKPKDFDKKC